MGVFFVVDILNQKGVSHEREKKAKRIWQKKD